MASQSPQSSRSSQPFTFSLETPSLSSGTLDKYLKSVLGESSTSTIPDLLKSQEMIATPSDGKADSMPPSSSTTTTTATTTTTTTSLSEQDLTTSIPTSASDTVTVEAAPSSPPPTNGHPPSNQQQLATTGGDELVTSPRGQNYIDITDYLNMPQSDAAKKLGIPPSTLSKRWKEAVRKRKWPYRMICKIDKEIMTLLHNVPQGPNAPPLSEEVELALGQLLRKRQEELRPVVIRI